MRGTFRLAVALSLLFAVCLVPCALHAQNMFRRGDVDDSGRINLTDSVQILQRLFGGRRGFPCSDAADVDDSGHIDLSDVVYTLSFLFQRGASPPPPFPGCGVDPTTDRLACGRVAGRCPKLPDALLDPLFEPLDARETVVFVIDRSGSMRDRRELGLAKSLVIQRIESFPEDYEFAVIFFDRSLLQYPEDGIPVRATREQKDAATSWIASVPGGGGTCPEQALSAALIALRRSAAAGKRIIYLGDGGATCAGVNEQEMMARTLDTVGAQNTEGAILHAAYIGVTHPVQLGFLQALVDAHEGLLIEVGL